MLCYQCVVMCGRVMGVTGKLKGGRFYGVVIINSPTDQFVVEINKVYCD